jgi:flagellar hook-length control protein FliK
MTQTAQPLLLDLLQAMPPVALSTPAPEAGGEFAARIEALLGELRGAPMPEEAAEAPEEAATPVPIGAAIDLQAVPLPIDPAGPGAVAPVEQAEDETAPVEEPERSHVATGTPAPQADHTIARAGSLLNLVLGTAPSPERAPAAVEPASRDEETDPPAPPRASDEPVTSRAPMHPPELPRASKDATHSSAQPHRAEAPERAPVAKDDPAVERPPARVAGAEPVPAATADVAPGAQTASHPHDAAPRANPAAVVEAASAAPAEPPGARDSGGAAQLPRALPELPAHGEVEVVRSVRVLAEQGGGRVSIRLDPPELGGLSVRVVVSDGAVHVSLLADQAPVADLLQRHSADLRSALENHGLRLDRLDVGAGDVDLGSRDAHFREADERGAAGGRAPQRMPSALPLLPTRRFDVNTLGAVDLHV